MKKFTVNGTEYVAKPFTFNLMCDLEDMGISIEGMDKKPVAVIRAYFALCSGKNIDFAGKELEEHLIKNGGFEEIVNAMNYEMEKSDFFRSLNKTAEEKNAKGKDEKN